jgi:hypothetical protein
MAERTETVRQATEASRDYGFDSFDELDESSSSPGRDGGGSVVIDGETCAPRTQDEITSANFHPVFLHQHFA